MRAVWLIDSATDFEVQLTGLFGGECNSGVMVRITGKTDDRCLRLAGAAKRFGLTQAQSTLIGALCSGASLIEAAAPLNVAHATVKTHLQRIFDKSETYRQAEIFRSVFVS